MFSKCKTCVIFLKIMLFTGISFVISFNIYISSFFIFLSEEAQILMLD